MSLVVGGSVLNVIPLGTLPSHPGLHHAKQLPSTHTRQSLRPHSLPGCPIQMPTTFRAALKPPHLKSSVEESLSPPEAYFSAVESPKLLPTAAEEMCELLK